MVLGKSMIMETAPISLVLDGGIGAVLFQSNISGIMQMVSTERIHQSTFL